MNIDEKREEILKARGWTYDKIRRMPVYFFPDTDFFASCKVALGCFDLAVSTDFPPYLESKLSGGPETDFVHMLNKIPDIIAKLEEVRELTADCYAV